MKQKQKFPQHFEKLRAVKQIKEGARMLKEEEEERRIMFNFTLEEKEKVCLCERIGSLINISILRGCRTVIFNRCSAERIVGVPRKIFKG